MALARAANARYCQMPATQAARRASADRRKLTPKQAGMRTDWDLRCGFANAQEAMAQRRQEDRRALATLRAQPVWMDFIDSQYGPAPGEDDIARSLRQVLRALGPTPVLLPMGMFHADHLLVHRACLKALAHWPDRPALAYEDALYRAKTGLLQQRLTELAAQGITATPDARQPQGGAGRGPCPRHCRPDMDGLDQA